MNAPQVMEGEGGTAVPDEGVILIASSDASVGSLIAARFERAGYLTLRLSTGEETLSWAKQGVPLLVVIDLELSDMTGYEACFELRERVGDRLPIILLSGSRTEPSDRVAGLLIGADDYLAKPFDPGELLVRARRLLVRSPRRVPLLEAPLTSRESQVLQLLAGGLSQERIAKELFITSKTVASHIQRILSKLEVHSRTEAVALAYRHGLIEVVAPES